MSDQERFQYDVYNVVIDNVIAGLTERYKTMNSICELFSFIWRFEDMAEEELADAARKLIADFPKDLTSALVEEVQHLNTCYRDNFESGKVVKPLKLLNDIMSAHLDKEIFPELVIALKIFLVLPVSVASGERSFSQLNFIKNERRSCMTEQRLNNLATLNMNYDIARSLDFSGVVKSYAKKRALADPGFF